MNPTLKRLFDSARKFHGLVLQRQQVREIAGLIVNMDKAIEQLNTVLEAYVTDYGADVLNSFTTVEAEVVEGEIVAAETDTDEEGQEDGEAGLEPQGESQGDVDILTVFEHSDFVRPAEGSPDVL